MLTPFVCRSCNRHTYREHLQHLPAETRLLAAIFADDLCAHCLQAKITLQYERTRKLTRRHHSPRKERRT